MTSQWIFTEEQMLNTPSRRCGIDMKRENICRQNSALFIRDIGNRLKLGLSICDTAIIYMHRFYMHHSFTKFHRNSICMSAIFLSCKVEEFPYKLEFIIKTGYTVLHKNNIDVSSDTYQLWSDNLIYHENLLIRTLGLNLAVESPNKHIMIILEQFHVGNKIILEYYYFASSMLLTSTFNLKYNPKEIAYICVFILGRWTGLNISDDLLSSSGMSVEKLNDSSTKYIKLYEELPELLKNCCFKNIKKFSQEFILSFLNQSSIKSHDEMILSDLLITPSRKRSLVTDEQSDNKRIKYGIESRRTLLEGQDLSQYESHDVCANQPSHASQENKKSWIIFEQDGLRIRFKKVPET